MKLLGLQNWASHDSSVCVLSDETDGDFVEFATIAEERLMRSKNSYQFPFLALTHCMDRLGIEHISEIDYLVSDYAQISRWINSGPHYRKLLYDYTKLRLDLPDDRIVIVRHHDGHAANAFYPSGYDDAAILVVDGFGSEGETVSLYHGNNRNIKVIERSFDYGPGMLYEVVTKLLGFTGNNGVAQPGKTMGLSPYGEHAPGPILDIQAQYDGLRIDYSHFMSRLPFCKIKQNLTACTNPDSLTGPYYARIAYDVQKEVEQSLIHLAHYALEKTGSRNLVISGGVGLNCVANGKLLDSIPFEGLFIQPACADDGIELGLLLYAYYNVLPVTQPKLFTMPHVYTGKSYDLGTVRGLLEEKEIRFKEASPRDVAKAVASGQIVGWFYGGSEMGPRALGHRSILADPRNSHMKDIINSRVKHREAFRPFAPSVLQEYADDFFELDLPSPYMLLACDVREEKRDSIPAVTHIDGTSRVQTVSRTIGGAYYEVIDEFRKITDVPMIMNTSFNDNNEPIVETPEDSLITFLSTEIDALYLEGLFIEKNDIDVSQTSHIRSELLEEREKRREHQFQIFLNRCSTGWNEADIAEYHERELIKACWYRDHAAIETIIDFVDHAIMDQQSVCLVGTRDHTKILYDLIPRFRNLDVVGVTYLPESDWEVVAFDEFEAVDGVVCDPDVVLITTYEFQEKAAQMAQSIIGSNTKVICPYKSWSENPRFVLNKIDGVQPSSYPGEKIFWGESDYAD